MNPSLSRHGLRDLLLLAKAVPCQPLSASPVNTIMNIIFSVDYVATIPLGNSGILRQLACIGSNGGVA